MKLKQLSVNNLRAFDQAAFDFHPEFTLLVGINGVGKTTVIETLRICLSRILPRFTASRTRPKAFNDDDIQVGAAALTVELDHSINSNPHKLLIYRNREQSVIHEPEGALEQNPAALDRETLTPDFGSNAKAMKKAQTQPLGLYFGTQRSFVSYEQPMARRASGGQSTAFAYALVERTLRLPEFGSWMLAQEEMSSTLPRAVKHLNALQTAVDRFLPECTDLRAVADSNPKLHPKLLVKKQSKTLDVRQLSNGERGMLALVLDLATRLSQANPELDDPIRDGAGIVLIDEIDLHLHPQWQRRIVGQLCETFPNCQFVATTHSPQVIGEVTHDRIRIIKDGNVRTPSNSFGLESSRILEELMGTKSRNAEIDEQISKISMLIDTGESDAAKKEIEDLSKKIGEGDPEIIRAVTYLGFMEDDACEKSQKVMRLIV